MTENATVELQALRMPRSLVYQGVPKPAPEKQGTVTQDYDLNRFGPCVDLGDPLRLSDLVHAVTSEDIQAPVLEIPSQPVVSVSTRWTDVSPWAKAETWFRVCLLCLEATPENVPVPFIVPGVENEVLEFAAREGLMRYLPAVRDLVYDCFPTVSDVGFEIESDPDTGDKWISVNARVSGSPERIVAEYDEFTRRSLVELPEQAMERIRLFYYVD